MTQVAMGQGWRIATLEPDERDRAHATRRVAVQFDDAAERVVTIEQLEAFARRALAIVEGERAAMRKAAPEPVTPEPAGEDTAAAATPAHAWEPPGGLQRPPRNYPRGRGPR